MIFVAAGTEDGRELAGELLAAGYEVTASVVSRYGEALLQRYPGLQINDTPLNQAEMVAYMQAHAVQLFVDASHPYAANVSANAMAACRAAHVPYLRYEREETPLVYEKAHVVKDYHEAAQVAASLGKHIFLTTGSRNLEAFMHDPALTNCEVTARVLPDAQGIAACERAGLNPAHIIAMQGPFSQALNEALYQKYQAQVVVMKNSGAIGGTDTKVAAAMAMHLPIVLIERPKITYDRLTHSIAEAVRLAGEILQTRQEELST